MSDPLAAIIATLDDHTLEGFDSRVVIADECATLIDCACGWTGTGSDHDDASDLWRTHRAAQVLAAIRAEDG